MTPVPPPVGEDRMGYYHLLVCAALIAAQEGDFAQARLIQGAADDVADDLAAEVVRSLP